MKKARLRLNKEQIELQSDHLQTVIKLNVPVEFIIKFAKNLALLFVNRRRIRNGK